MSALTVGAFCVGLSAQAQIFARPLDTVRQAGTLRVAVYSNYKPYSWVEDGKNLGIDVEIAQALAKSLGVKLDLFELRADDNLDDDLRNGVWRGTVFGAAPGDVMMHVPYDKRIEAKNDRVVVAAPYHIDGLALAVDPAKAAEALDLSLFLHDKVAVDVGTLADMILVSVFDQKVIPNVVHQRSAEKAANAFESGEVSAFYGEASAVQSFAKTGKLAWKKEIDDFKGGYSATAAPLIVPTKANGALIITGVSGGEFGVVGRVEARSAETGEIVWVRPVLEGLTGSYKGKETTMTGKANESWPGDMYKFGGGATWLGGTYDPGTGLVYFGTGNPSPWNSHMRLGDNKWTASRVAIDPETGELKWGFQTTPHDGWDYDGVNEFISFDLTKDGKTVKAGATADRNGFFYVLDRTDGKFISAMPFVSKINWAKGIDANGRPIYNDDSRPGDPTKSEDGKAGKEVYAVPSFLGGKNQMPMAYSNDTHLFYVPSNEWGMDIHNEPVAYKKGAAYLGAGFTIHTIFDDHIGSLKAIDPATSKIVWEYKNKAPLWGGVLTTAGGLVFTGTPEGYLKAFDDKTGEVVWQFNVGTGIVAPPISWEQDGQQMIGVTAGWGGAVPLWGGDVAKLVKDINQGGSFWVFKLPQKTASN